MNTNNIFICGKIISDIETVKTKKGSSCFFKLAIARHSNVMDKIFVMCPAWLLFNSLIYKGGYVRINGSIVTENRKTTHNKLFIYVLCTQIKRLPDSVFFNLVELEGFICKKPVYRQTPLGKRITDLLIASNYSAGKSNYIPAIAWSGNALKAYDFPVGTHIRVRGRLQSRPYEKATESETIELVAYEVSISYIEKLAGQPQNSD